MFTANENILLRQHKRRVIQYVESTIPENALEVGTMVMVMEVSCRQPGCVPIETAITIVFPKPPKQAITQGNNHGENKNGSLCVQSERDEKPAFTRPLIPGLEESRIGGAFKTRILKPLSDVTQDDVFDSLPPSFKGGRRTVESLCLKARDVVFAQIGQIVGDDDTNESKDGRKMIAEYLKLCLSEYVANGCPHDWNEAFTSSTEVGMKLEIPPNPLGEVAKPIGRLKEQWGVGNVVLQRSTDDDVDQKYDNKHSKADSVRHFQQQSEIAASFSVSSQEFLQHITKAENAPGVRRPGCPCCEPDSVETYLDKVMML